jgi:hypothetical protein
MKALLFVAVCAAVVSLLPSVVAQEATAPKRTGYPQDWSQQHIVFSFDALAKHPNLIDREIRVRQLVMKHAPIPNYGSFQTTEAADPLRAYLGKTSHTPGVQRDWTVAVGGHLGIDQSPVKFGFYPDAPPDCVNDFVAYGMSNTNNANLIGFNNLYSNPGTGGGLCDITPPYGPNVLFAYNIDTVTGGHIITSPIVSLDGTKIGFVESVPASSGSPQAYFHVVTTSQGGSLSSPISLTSTPTPLVEATVPLSLTASDLHSSPWIDYSSDTVYVGTDDGFMHKITGVFNGVPTEVITGVTGGWPISVGTGLKFSPPVLDQVRGLLMFGASDGNLYQIDTVAGVLHGSVGVGTEFSPGVVAAPIVDVANGTTFAVTADAGAFGAAIYQYRTANLTPLSQGNLGLGAATPSGGTATAMNLYDPAFSHGYFTNPSTGVLSLCGTGPSDTTPWQYVFGFDASANMLETPLHKAQLVPAFTSAATRCSGWTEFYNPNVPSGGADYFFFGLTQDCTSTTGTSLSGCVAEETNLTPTTPSSTPVTVTINGGSSAIVIDNDSTEPQASSIYFGAVKQQNVYKLTQNGLQ